MGGAGGPIRDSTSDGGDGSKSAIDMAKKKTTTTDSKAQAKRVVAALEALHPDADCALVHEGPFQLLAATILSAQCTDARVNLVTPVLFARYPDAPAMAAAEPDKLEEVIRSTGFFRAKARSLLGMATRLRDEFGGEIPRDLEALTSLPGVGRKTANVVLGTAFGLASGVVVDTHVKRVAFRLGLTANTDPERIERDLMAILPRAEWVVFSHRVILHGRQFCLARKPWCGKCPLASFCPKVGVRSSQ